MEFRILAIGDVVGKTGVSAVTRWLPETREKTQADFVVVNGENACGVGMTAQQGEALLSAGADAITLGNHAFSPREALDYLDTCPQVLRPANFSAKNPGRGWAVFDTPVGEAALINLIGRVSMDYTPDNPFLLADRLVQRLHTNLILVELHAEATSEKVAMGRYLDGRVSAVWGTHTHVPTADAQVLPGGTGYVTDLGMTGPRDGVLGADADVSIARFLGSQVLHHRWTGQRAKMEGVLFTIDSETGRCCRVERVDRYEDTPLC